MTNLDNLETRLSKPPAKLLKTNSSSKMSLRYSDQTQIDWRLYLDQINDGSHVLLSKHYYIPK